MAFALDFPSAFAKAERAAGRPLPAEGTAFLSVRDEDKAALVPVAQALVVLGFRLVATEGTAAALTAVGIDVEPVAKVSDAAGDSRTVVDLIRKRRCQLVLNTPQGSEARSDGYRIREAALRARVPCITTLAGAAAAVEAIAGARTEAARSLQERHEAQRGETHGSPAGPFLHAGPQRAGARALAGPDPASPSDGLLETSDGKQNA
jgi:carbamoyl-phosphate synthase large subunit